MLIVPFGEVTFASIKTEVQHGVDRIQILVQLPIYHCRYYPYSAILWKRNRADGTENTVFVDRFD